MNAVENREREARWAAAVQGKYDNKASDGAYFTRPQAADIASRLTLDLLEERPPTDCAFISSRQMDWTAKQTWKALKTLDPAVGSGILLVSLLAEMKRRARLQGASETQIAVLQKLAVEETLKGMDINPVSLQLAASALTIGNENIRYQKMGLHLMPYGPQKDGSVKAGTLELLGQKGFLKKKLNFCLTIQSKRQRLTATRQCFHFDWKGRA